MSIKAKIITGMLLTIILVTTVGIIAHRSLSDLVQTLRDEAKPNMKLVILKNTLSGISNAESSVRAYTITQDTIYLYQYFNSINAIERSLQRLVERTQDPKQLQRIDSLTKLVESKFSLLDELIYLKKDDQVGRVFQKLSSNLTNVEEDLNKRRKFWDALVNKRKAEMEDIQEVVSEVKKEELKKAEDISKKELDLTQKDNQVMLRIRKIVDEMEMHETNMSKQRAAEVSETAKTTTNIITTFSIIVFFLLLLLGYLVLTWITRNRKTNEALFKAKMEAEKLAKREAEFLANMSHEMRTPMNAIVGFSEQLSKTSLSNEQEKYLSTIRNSTEHLLVIINDILDQAKLKSGKIAFESVGFEVREVIDNVYKTLAEQEKTKGIKFTAKIDDDVPDILVGDPIRLTQILINLASNAIKFTDEGKVEILCKPVLKDEQSLKLHIEVIDTGIGIEEEHLEKIFEDFYQADMGATRNYGGTGLGLAITKRLVELQEGTISVVSKKGEGSKFTVTIPYKIGNKADLEGQQSAMHINYNTLNGKTVLVADDEEYNRLLLKTILQKAQMKITLCENGKEVLEALKSDNYDLILMDVRMPVMDGLETTKHIRKDFDPPHSKIPIIALTAAANTSDAVECMQAGMDGFLSKPFKEAELYQKIKENLALEDEPATGESAAIEQEKTGDNEQPEKNLDYDLGELVELSNGDENFIIEMLETFVRNAKADLKKLKEEFDAGKMHEVSLRAHKVVAPCRHLGLDNMTAKLKEIENTAETADAERIKQLIEQVTHEAQALFKQLKDEIGKRKKTV